MRDFCYTCKNTRLVKVTWKWTHAEVAKDHTEWLTCQKCKPKKIMSDKTPRTDEVLHHSGKSSDIGEFARILERENNELIRNNENLEISILAMGNRVNELGDENKELLELVNLITKQEMSDNGNLFYPTSIDSCRCMDLERAGQITEKYRSTPHITTEDYHGE